MTPFQIQTQTLLFKFELVNKYKFFFSLLYNSFTRKTCFLHIPTLNFVFFVTLCHTFKRSNTATHFAIILWLCRTCVITLLNWEFYDAHWQTFYSKCIQCLMCDCSLILTLNMYLHVLEETVMIEKITKNWKIS